MPGDRVGRGGTTLRFPPELFATATSLFFWGNDRTTWNRVVYHVSRLGDPTFVWLEIADAKDPPGAAAPSIAAPGQRSRLVRVRAGDLRPRLRRGSTGLARLLGTDAPVRMLSQLLLFLQLPVVVQQLIGSMAADRGVRVLAVSNSDRIAEFYASESRIVGRFVRAIRRMRATLVVSYCGPEWSDKMAWDDVLRVIQGPVDGQDGPAIICEKGPPSTAWRVGAARPLGHIPVLAQAGRARLRRTRPGVNGSVPSGCLRRGPPVPSGPASA